MTLKGTEGATQKAVAPNPSRPNSVPGKQPGKRNSSQSG